MQAKNATHTTTKMATSSSSSTMEELNLEYEKQILRNKRKSQVRNGSFSAVMEKEKQAELEAEYLKLHDMFPEENRIVEETFFEQNFGDDDEEEDDEEIQQRKREIAQRPKRRGTITKLISMATTTKERSSSTTSQPTNIDDTLPPAPLKKRTGSIFSRLAGNG